MVKLGNVSNQGSTTHGSLDDCKRRTYSKLDHGSILDSFNRMSKLIIPVLALWALANIPKTEAFIGAYAFCVGPCMLLSGPAALSCFAVCAPLLPAPVI